MIELKLDGKVAIVTGAFETDAQSAGRMGDADEMATLVCYLASNQSDFVTGSVFVIDGGESSKL